MLQQLVGFKRAEAEPNAQINKSRARTSTRRSGKRIAAQARLGTFEPFLVVLLTPARMETNLANNAPSPQQLKTGPNKVLAMCPALWQQVLHHVLHRRSPLKVKERYCASCKPKGNVQSSCILYVRRKCPLRDQVRQADGPWIHSAQLVAARRVYLAPFAARCC